MRTITAQIAHELLLATRAYRVAVYRRGYDRVIYKAAMRSAIERAKALRLNNPAAQHVEHVRDFYVMRYSNMPAGPARVKALEAYSRYEAEAA